MQRGAGSEPLDDLPGGLVFLMGVGPGAVAGERIGGGLGEELGAGGERFPIQELVFGEAVHGLDIAWIGVSRRRDAEVLAVAPGGGEAGGKAESIVPAMEWGWA